MYNFQTVKIITINKKNIDRNLYNIKKELLSFDGRVYSQTKKIVDDVRTGGDDALFRYTKKFDNHIVNRKNIMVSEEEIKWSRKSVSADYKGNIRTAISRIREYQSRKLPRDHTYKDSFGNELGWLVRPLERVGIYVPGGKAAYPSTVLMTAVPARVAGVKEIIMVSPCTSGEINPYVIAAADLAGVDAIYKIGGAQSVAALAYGTESVPRVDKIVGPGNIYVTVAKKLVYGSVDIDMLAGPSEVLVIADGSCPPSWVAADLLAQAEHDEIAVPVMVTTSRSFATAVRDEIKKQLPGIKRTRIARESVKNNGKIYIVDDLDTAAAVSNAIAPEHLELCVRSPKVLLKKIQHAGAIFLGSMSTESFGDYICGPSHVLPTGGSARYSSPLSVYDFVKMPSVIKVSRKGFRELSDIVIDLAETENLDAHAKSVRIRL